MKDPYPFKNSILPSYLKTKCTRRTNGENTTLTTENRPGFTGVFRSGTNMENFTGKGTSPPLRVRADIRSGGSMVDVTGKEVTRR